MYPKIIHHDLLISLITYGEQLICDAESLNGADASQPPMDLESVRLIVDKARRALHA